MPIIKIKRGLKSNMPVLNDGELAFANDSKELFIGYSNQNIALTTMNGNLINNGNFQYPVTNQDYLSYTLAPGASTYLFGNFYIQNMPSSQGNIVIKMPFMGIGRLQITCTNALINIEYRLTLPRYPAGGPYYSPFMPLENHTMTTSFDILNSTGNIIEGYVGQPSILNPININPNTNRYYSSFIYYKSTTATNNNPSMNFVLFRSKNSINGNFEIGNFKVEEYAKPTPFMPKSLIEDIAAIREYYEEISASVIGIIQDANTIIFKINSNINSSIAYNLKLTLLSISIFNNNSIQSGFSSLISYDAANNLIIVTCTKNSHGLTSPNANIKFIKDLRP